MDWGNFFRPATAKIIFFIVIFIALVPFILYDNGIRCITTPCPSETMGSVAMWLLLSHNFVIYGYDFFFLIVGLIVSYLAACLIVHLANRPKKK